MPSLTKGQEGGFFLYRPQILQHMLRRWAFGAAHTDQCSCFLSSTPWPGSHVESRQASRLGGYLTG